VNALADLSVSVMFAGRLLSACVRCGGGDIITDVSHGDVICRDCGEVQISRIIDESSEWTLYSNDDKGRGDSVMRASGSGKETVWSYQSIFVGGSSQQRAALQKAQLMSESKSVIMAAAYIEEVPNLASKLSLSSALTVSTLSSLFTRLS
jgi:transcription initiation factor TFIIIB Brf1 subunit/transcription initiation factor TFIIB